MSYIIALYSITRLVMYCNNMERGRNEQSITMFI